LKRQTCANEFPRAEPKRKFYERIIPRQKTSRLKPNFGGCWIYGDIEGYDSFLEACVFQRALWWSL
jgi:hypothetical protein